MGIFGKSFVYSKKQMRPDKIKHSRVMQRILKNKKIASVLEQRAERRELFQALRDQAQKGDGDLSLKDMRKVMGKFRLGKGKTIDRNEAQILARELIKTGKKYDFSKDSTAAESSLPKSRFPQRPGINNRPPGSQPASVKAGPPSRALLDRPSRFSSSSSVPRPTSTRSMPKF